MPALDESWQQGYEEAIEKLGFSDEHKVSPRRSAKELSRIMGIKKLPGVVVGQDVPSWNGMYARVDRMGRMTPWGSGKQTVVLGKTPYESIVAHELGHVLNHEPFPRITHTLGTLSRSANMLGALVLPAFSMLRPGQPSWRLPLIHLAASTPMLIDEAVASGRAMKALNEKYGPMGALKRSGPLLTGFGSYALTSALPALSVLARKQIQSRLP